MDNIEAQTEKTNDNPYETWEKQMYYWQSKVLDAVKKGSAWELSSCFYGELNARNQMLRIRVEELEKKLKNIVEANNQTVA